MTNEPTSTVPVDEYLDYVCQFCFLPLGKCECEVSWHRRLVHIDRGIQEVIATLNRKGYVTEYCCEGHAPNYSTYLTFRNDYGIGEKLPTPEGFKYVKRGYQLEAIRPKKATEEVLAKIKAERIASLLAWAEELPDYPELG